MYDIPRYYVHGWNGNGKKKMVVALPTKGIGRRKRELVFPKRRLYCLVTGGEHDEVDDTASVGSVEHQWIKRP
jgi:hypothetical protein